MKTLGNTIGQIFKTFSGTEKNQPASVQNEQLILKITQSALFSQMSVQDQIVSLSRLVDSFERTYGYVPQKYCATLVNLNNRLNAIVSASLR